MPVPRGEAHYLAKLTNDAVEEIRSRAIGVKTAARKYGVCPKTIRQIRAGETWRHLLDLDATGLANRPDAPAWERGGGLSRG